MNELKFRQLKEMIEWCKKNDKTPSKPSLDSATPEDLKVMRFVIMIGTMLSARTTDAIAESALESLSKIDGGMTCQNLSKQNKSTVEELISKVSFKAKKAQAIIDISKTMIEKYDGDIPRTKEELLELPRIGEKCANLIMSEAWGESTGTAVDTHVHRVANRLKFVKTTNPLSTSNILANIIPSDQWDDAGLAMYSLGQQICQARTPKCSECPIHECPSHV